MKTWRPRLGGSCFSLAVLPLALTLFAGLQPFAAQDRDAGADKRMLAAFAKRSKSCEPRAPIETEFNFDRPPVPGASARLIFRVMSMEPGPGADVRFDLPSQVTVRSGNVRETGNLVAKKAFTFDLDVAVLGRGQFEIHASVIAGEPNYRFGRRETLYLTNDGTRITVSKVKPPNPRASGGAVQLGTGVNEVITPTPAPPNWGTPELPPLSDTLVDPKGDPLDGGNDGGGKQSGPAAGRALPEAFAPFANVTVSGTWRYRHDDNTLHAGYGTQVVIWDDDTLSGDDLMASVIVGYDASWSATFDNADGEGGTTDIYLEFRTVSGAVNVHNNGNANAWYTTSTGVLANNIPNGTYNAGGWYADWGTNGVADGNERAWEVLDYMSRAWAYANYDLGHDAHPGSVTYVQWYDGSLDGSYYDPPTDRIHLDGLDFSSPDVLMHEFGHNLMDSAYNEVYIPNSGGAHSFTGHYNTRLAWSEGWATWFQCAAQNDDWIYQSFDPDNLLTFDCDSNWDGNGTANGNSDNASNNPNWGYDTESAVLAFLIDLDDPRNDATDMYDWTTLGPNEIWDVTRNYDPAGANPNVYGVQEFYDGWMARGWGWHPQMNGQMHVHGMNQGIGKPFLGLSSGVSLYAGTWYYGGYGRGSYDVKNYGSVAYDLNRCYVWLRGPAGQDIGQFGSDGNGTPIPARTTRSVWVSADQTGYNPSAPNFVYGTYTVTAGHYRTDNAWQLLEPAEGGTATTVNVNIIRDTDAPDFCTVADDGACQNDNANLHIVATAVDADSSIKSYWTRVGTSPGSGNEQDWVEHPANNTTTFDYTITGLTMSPNTTYYVTVVARNIEGYDTWAYTDGIIASDATPPGAVTVTDDGNWTANLTQLNVSAASSETDGCIKGYWTRVGTSAGQGDEQDWIFHNTGDVDTFSTTLTGLSLTPGQDYFITVVARNVSNLDTFGYSNGIRAVAQPRTLTVTSTNPSSGVNVGVTTDLDGLGTGSTAFTRVYENGTSVSLNVPGQVGSSLFDHVELDGAPHTGPIPMDGDHTVNVVYVNGYSVSIQSTNPNSGVFITVWNNDFYNRIGGTTTFSRIYKDGKPCSMTAPNSAGGNWFSHWVLDGAVVPGTSRTLSMTMNMAHTARAVYATGRTLTVNSVNPASGVPITVYLTDKNGLKNGTTSFVRNYANGATVGLTAPKVVGTNYFLRWDLDGSPWQATPTVNVPMSANRTLTAVYGTGQTITVQASEPAVPITVWIVDKAGLKNASTTFSRLYATGTEVSFTAPATANGKPFLRWDKDGVPVPGGSKTVKFPADAPHTIQAVFGP